MPTPFMHLDIAEQMRVNPRLNHAAHKLIEAERAAFYLGHVAADYQTICNIPREDTHFYNLPPAPDVQGPRAMFARYPQLAEARQLPQSQAVFIAAYSSHLIVDLRWYREILIPYFLQPTHWKDHRQRFTVHNILLTYLDRRSWSSLPADAGELLGAAQPDGWLPFAQTADLARWRNMLTRQLAPGATTETVTIFAGRLDMTPAEFTANLENPQWMKEQVFRRVSLRRVNALLAAVMEDSVTFINNYFSG